jgi:fibronectin type 3 domain-containing protein
MKNFIKLTVYLLMIIFFLITGCTLDRKNPLDPRGNSDIEEPMIISGFSVTTSNASVMLRWDKLDDIREYKVYRSLQYDGIYEYRLTATQIESVSVIECIENDVQIETYYYYKVSAVNKQGLEGKLCEPKGVRVKN